MSVEMAVNVQGLPELQRKLERLDENLRIHVDDALGSEVRSMQTLAQSLAPRRSGYLASTVYAERIGEWTFKLGARAGYARFVEFGTRFLRARRFLSRALELGMPSLVQRVNQAVAEAVAEAAAT
ncbi:MAG TPA: HK97-gp10 family putative phage morphogenesis protein [Candidatus Bathyarchaeia archaeon]|nr:HK97-gp10 family putative phage morphogenesis protein [Candidatus Bathyarchaeia archaeon]